MTIEHLDPTDPIPWLRRIFNAAVEAVQPTCCCPPYLPSPPVGRTVVVGAGKAAASMARAVESHWPDPISGLVVTRYGHNVPCQRIETVEAAHPVPDRLSTQAARRMLETVSRLERTDLVLALISGGGSALLSLPAPGVTLSDKQQLSHALLNSGAAIDEINTVRSQLSAIKGGQLAVAASPARVVTLVISDVPDNNPAWVASGPTVPNHTSPADALAVLNRYGITTPTHVRTILENRHAGTRKQPSPDNTITVIATAADALDVASKTARSAEVDVQMLGDALVGEARELGRKHGCLALELQKTSRGRPLLLLSGGETTVTVDHPGRGGRNTEYLLALALAIDGTRGIHALAADTDGIDGSQDNAGAVLSPNTLTRAQAAGIDAATCLAHHNSYDFFQSVGDLLITGPTRTNVNDFRAILIQPPASTPPINA